MNASQPWWQRGLVDAIDGVASGKVSARALADAWLARIDATEDVIGAWAHLDRQHVHRAAEQCDSQGTPAPLRGIGVGVKDIIGTADLPTELGSPIFAGRRTEDAECVARLKRAGGYVFGKTVTTSFAFLDPGKTRNPWKPTHTPGGSSQGSAAAVATGHIAGALGTQTNGSVIRPAAYCGIVGFKPTRNLIPFDGVHVFSETLDQLGVLTRSVRDAARLAAPLAAHGRMASRVVLPDGMPRLAYLGDYPWTRMDCDADDTLEAAATRLRERGAIVVGVDLPPAWREADQVHRTIMLYEAAQHLGPLQERERGRMSPRLNAALDEGRGIARADYEGALHARERAIAELTAWLAPYDAILSPSAPTPAPEGLESTGDPSCCTLWSLLGFPAITIPAGVSDDLPVGMQIAAAQDQDDRLLGIAAWCEAQVEFRGLVHA